MHYDKVFFKSFSDEAYKSQILLKIFFRRSLRLHNVWRLKPPHKVNVKVKVGGVDGFDVDFDVV
ncbi:MAG: hypothetical protein LBH93_01140, partial [Chitinispirillales bacterium]|nr:hypothetical protein [Chitinispirillales bacterium]